MPSPCTVCLHPDRAEVDRRLARECVKVAPLARTLGVGRKALERHRDRHVSSPGRSGSSDEIFFHAVTANGHRFSV